jgi:hypothetical protein
MDDITIRDLRKIFGEAIGALPGPTPVKSGDRVVGLLIPLKAKASSPDERNEIRDQRPSECLPSWLVTPHLAPHAGYLLALAWSVETDVWTTDRDFAGAGIATWSTPNLMRALGEAATRKI